MRRLAMGVVLAVLPVFWGARAEPPPPDLKQAAEIVEEYHYNQVDVPDAATASVSAFSDYLSGLDPYSKLMPPAGYEALLSRTEMSRDGYGIALVEFGGRFVIVPGLGGPVYRTGLRAPQYIVDVNGAAPSDLSQLDTAFQAGEITLKLRDAVSGKVTGHTFSQSAYTEQYAETWRAGGKSYIRVNSFIRRKTAPAVIEAVRALPAGQRDVILDLRFNAGGEFTEALEIADQLTAHDGLLATVIETDSLRTDYTASAERSALADGRPVTVLVSPYTSSSAEILARALKHAGATVIGSRTYGKCLAQNIFPVDRGWALLISTKKVLDPEGSYCNGTGLDPDISLPDDLFDSAALIRAIPQPRRIKAGEPVSTAEPDSDPSAAMPAPPSIKTKADEETRDAAAASGPVPSAAEETGGGEEASGVIEDTAEAGAPAAEASSCDAVEGDGDTGCPVLPEGPDTGPETGMDTDAAIPDLAETGPVAADPAVTYGPAPALDPDDLAPLPPPIRPVPQEEERRTGFPFLSRGKKNIPPASLPTAPETKLPGPRSGAPIVYKTEPSKAECAILGDDAPTACDPPSVTTVPE